MKKSADIFRYAAHDAATRKEVKRIPMDGVPLGMGQLPNRCRAA
jgi:hypothetical protein